MLLRSSFAPQKPLLRRYNGQRGNWKAMGKVFYLYYPAHLFLFGLLRLLLK